MITTLIVVALVGLFLVALILYVLPPLVGLLLVMAYGVIAWVASGWGTSDP